MAFEQKTWYNDGLVPDDAPEGTVAPCLDADNLNRIESGIADNTVSTKYNADKVDYLSSIVPLPSYLTFVGNANANMVAAAFGKGNEDEMLGVGKALKMYANFKGNTENVDFLDGYDKYADLVADHKCDLAGNSTLYTFIKSSSYANDILLNTNVGLPDIVLYDKGSTEYFDIANATVYDWKDNAYTGKHEWAACDSNLNTDGNISIKKDAATNATGVTAYKYTIPIIKMPNLVGYRYLHIKLSDTEPSLSYEAYGNNSVSFAFAGQSSTVSMPFNGTSVKDPYTGLYGDLTLYTGKEYTFDLFSAYRANPSSNNFVISLYMCSYSNSGENGVGGRFTRLHVHIDKIWLSET